MFLTNTFWIYIPIPHTLYWFYIQIPIPGHARFNCLLNSTILIYFTLITVGTSVKDWSFFRILPPMWKRQSHLKFNTGQFKMNPLENFSRELFCVTIDILFQEFITGNHVRLTWSLPLIERKIWKQIRYLLILKTLHSSYLFCEIWLNWL